MPLPNLPPRYRVHPTNIKCPTCQAAVGHPCVDLMWGHNLPYFHPARSQMA